MNINPEASTILCYGDSNTWGLRPDGQGGRFPANERWTGRLQALLGDNFAIVEEGLSFRTTDIDDDPALNGKTYLESCIKSHNPLDIVAIMLGTNDLKTDYNRSANDIAVALGGLVYLSKEVGQTKTGQSPDVLLISPILLDNTAPDFTGPVAKSYDDQSVQKSVNLAGAIEVVASKIDARFFDASKVAFPSSDGRHMGAESHAALATALAEMIIAR